MKNSADIITAFEGFICNFVPCCTSDEYNLELCKKVLELLKELSSTITMTQTATSISYTATGDAKRGMNIGFIYGTSSMYEHIWLELYYKDLLTKEVREVLKKAKRDMMDRLTEEGGSE